MGLTPFPSGASSFGMPLLGGGWMIPQTLGAYYFVHATTGNNANHGLDPDHAFATIDYAINLCTAGNGDVIIAMPGHIETIINATTIIPDIQGVTIVGLGIGHNRAMIKFNNANAKIILSVADVSLRNLVFMAVESGVVDGIQVTGDNCSVYGCEWNYESTGDDFIIMLDFDGSDNSEAIGNVFLAEDTTAGTTEAIRIDESDNLVIMHNIIGGDFTDSAIFGEGAASIGQNTSYNAIRNMDTTKGLCIDHYDTSTGVIAHNLMGTSEATNWYSALDPGACMCVENYAANAKDETALIVPQTASA